MFISDESFRRHLLTTGPTTRVCAISDSTRLESHTGGNGLSQAYSISLLSEFDDLEKQDNKTHTGNAVAAQHGQFSETQTADFIRGGKCASYITPPKSGASLHKPSDFVDPHFGGLSMFYAVNEEPLKSLEQTPQAGQ